MTCPELAAADGTGISSPGPAVNDIPCPGMQARVRRRRIRLGLHNSTLWLGCMLLALCVGYWPVAAAMRPDRVRELRQETVNMFYHGFDNYMKIAFPEDEVCL